MKTKFYDYKQSSKNIDLDLLLENDLTALAAQEYPYAVNLADKTMLQIKQQHKKRKILKIAWVSSASAACLAGFFFFGHIRKEQTNDKLIAEMITEIYILEDTSYGLTEEDYLLASY